MKRKVCAGANFKRIHVGSVRVRVSMSKSVCSFLVFFADDRGRKSKASSENRSRISRHKKFQEE